MQSCLFLWVKAWCMLFCALCNVTQISQCHCQCHTPNLTFQPLPPNSAIMAYVTERTLLIFMHLSTKAVSTLWKIWVLRPEATQLWNKHVNMRYVLPVLLCTCSFNTLSCRNATITFACLPSRGAKYLDWKLSCEIVSAAGAWGRSLKGL